jgi:hypothetical protein
MTVVQDLLDEFQEIASGRLQWESYWRRVSAWVLPQTSQFDSLLSQGGTSGVMAVTSTPVAAERSAHIYDMTSLWGIDRLTAGLISLKTPESDYWHDLERDSDFGEPTTHDEKLALERTRDYLFKMRANPASNFWPSHKGAVKSMAAFGDGWLYIKDLVGQRTPFAYEFIPLPEAYPAVGPDSMPNRMFRPFWWTAHQVATEFGEAAGKKVTDMAADPKRRHQRIKVMHCVRPREDEKRLKPGTRGAKFSSWYILPEEKHLIGEGGFWEFPFTRYAWNDQGAGPYSEGPVAYALAEIQSLNALARDELLASQQHLRPPIATYGKNFTRLNFNPGASNPGLINGDGRPLFAPLTSGQRPDFAQAIIETRRAGVREALYLNLWQVLIADVQAGPETATEAMLRAQEKGEMLGPVGISLNRGLSHNVDREIGIIGRKGAFAATSPLAMPESLANADVSPSFTSPLDRLRKVSQIIGAQRTLDIAMALEGVKPGTLARIDADAILELAQEVYGAPVAILLDRKIAEAARAQNQQAQETATALGGIEAGGNAARAAGEGAAAMAAGTEALRNAPAIQRAIQQYNPAAQAA